MSKFLRWEKGRQAGAYSKMALLPEWLSKRLNADAYILHFPDQSSVPKHKDPVEPGYRHIRTNITLKRPDDGRQRMYCLGPVKRWTRIEIFRPDIYEHGLQTITGSMVMLSIGVKVKE